MRGYLLDTSVIAEATKAAPNRNVARWLDGVKPSNCYISALTIGELHVAIQKLPESASARGLLPIWLKSIIPAHFRDHVLSFDSAAAQAWGEILECLDAANKSIATIDAQVAAIAKVHDLTLVTRNAKRFIPCKVDLLDPWITEPSAAAR